MTDNATAAPIHATDHEAEATLVQLKVNTALSPKRVPIGFNRLALRYHRACACLRDTSPSFRNRRRRCVEGEQGQCQRMLLSFGTAPFSAAAKWQGRNDQN